MELQLGDFIAINNKINMIQMNKYGLQLGYYTLDAQVWIAVAHLKVV